MNPARKAANEMKERLDRLIAAEVALIEEATRNKSYLPDNYWLDQHKAQRMYQAALTLAEIFDEEDL